MCYKSNKNIEIKIRNHGLSKYRSKSNNTITVLSKNTYDAVCANSSLEGGGVPNGGGHRSCSGQ